MNVSFFENLRSKGYQVELRSILEDIRNGRWADLIRNARGLPVGSQAYQKAKRGLPSFMVSGTSSGGRKSKDFLAHSGCLQIDIDKVEGESVSSLRDRLGQDRYILAAWISPSGLGVKAIMLIPACSRHHKKAFRFAYEYMRRTHSVEIDPSCSDLTRVCYISHDPDLVYNPSATSLESEVILAHKEIFTQDSSILLNTNSCILYHKEFNEYSELSKFYHRLVHNRYIDPQKGLRNTLIVEIVVSCFYAVSPRFVLLFLKEYYQQHARVFSDYPLEKVSSEAEGLLESLISEYPISLTDTERAAFNLLRNDRERAAFRICRSLSGCSSNSSLQPPLFFLGCNQLGYRLGVVPMAASRIFKFFQSIDLIQKVSEGKYYSAGSPNVATVWRWIPGIVESPQVTVAGLVEKMSSCQDNGWQ